MSTRPLLGATSGESLTAPCPAPWGTELRSCLPKLFQGPSHKDSIPFTAIFLLLNANDKDERDQLTRQWRDHKIQELSFIGTVVRALIARKPIQHSSLTSWTNIQGALLAGCLASAGSWPDVLPDQRDKPWVVRASWQSGLVFALFAVIVSCQQSMRLHRLSAHRDGLKYIRTSLATRMGPVSTAPSQLQVYAWDTSILFLIGSIICAITGLTALVWLSVAFVADNPPKDALQRDSTKVRTAQSKVTP
jgi:hypothetical protein